MATDFIFTDRLQPVYVISVAAELSGLHAQTLRQYDRMGLVVPGRTKGGGRRYSAADIDLLREIQRLSGEGLGLEGVARVLRLQRENAELRREVEQLREALAEAEGRGRPAHRVFAAGDAGVVVLPRGRRPARTTTRGGSLVLWRPPQG